MQPYDPALAAYLSLRLQASQAEAERRRLLRDRGAIDPDEVDETVFGPLTALRRVIGTGLVRAGERIRGAERPATGDAATGGAHLRPVR